MGGYHQARQRCFHSNTKLHCTGFRTTWKCFPFLRLWHRCHSLFRLNRNRSRKSKTCFYRNVEEFLSAIALGLLGRSNWCTYGRLHGVGSPWTILHKGCGMITSAKIRFGGLQQLADFVIVVYGSINKQKLSERFCYYILWWIVPF